MSHSRMITTCPSAHKALVRKAKLSGAHVDYRIDQQQRNSSITFSVDFVNYYFGMRVKLLFCIVSKFNFVRYRKRKQVSDIVLGTR